jgi:hypothetical protein
MTQPIWKAIVSADDWILWTDTTGVYPEELEYCSEVGNERAEVYRFPIERLKLVNDPEDPRVRYLVSERYDLSWPHPVARYQKWFADDIPGVAHSCGRDPEDLLLAFTAEDPIVRMGAYLNLVGYFGPHEFDFYPRRSSYARWESYRDTDGNESSGYVDCPCCDETIVGYPDDLCDSCNKAECEDNPRSGYYDNCQIPECPECGTRASWMNDDRWHSNCDAECPNAGKSWE